jgi:hypothetical protein
MKIYVVLLDTGDHDGPASWVVEQVFSGEQMARDFAAQDIHRKMEAHNVVADDVTPIVPQAGFYLQPRRPFVDAIGTTGCKATTEVLK